MNGKEIFALRPFLNKQVTNSLPCVIVWIAHKFPVTFERAALSASLLKVSFIYVVHFIARTWIWINQNSLLTINN